MRKVLFLVPLVFLLMSGLSQQASAKARTVKIVISGASLTNAIQITDPRILGISNVWSGQFLDRTKPTAQEAPRGLRRYEVSFYVQVSDNEVAKKYVLYFYPSSAKDQGYIYLPRKGETWYSLNTGSIVRDGQDGKWNYASTVWERFIKPIIGDAERAQRRAAAHVS